MPQPRRVAMTGALLAALTGGLLTAAAAPATALPVGTQADFNRDGYPDLAVGAPLADISTKEHAGVVVVLYGSSSGLSSSRRTVIHQDSPDVGGAAEAGDLFGRALASADLDGDGYTDLAVGVPGEDVGTRDGLGSSTVLWGGPNGLRGGAVLPLPSYYEAGVDLGRGVATGDFNHDGHADVTVAGWTRTRTYYGPISRTGAPHLQVNESQTCGCEPIAGDLSGDGAAERLYPASTTSDPGGWIAYYRWNGSTSTSYTRTDMTAADGEPGAIGDINGDGYGDLVLGDVPDPSAGKPGGHLGGQIAVWYGGPTGPDPAQTPTVIHQDTAGVPGGGEAEDRFGGALSVGDANGDGYADVAVGAAGEDLSGQRDAGSVTVFYGSSSGLTTTGSRLISQNTSGVPGAAETGDDFGSAVRLADVTGDGRAELAIGAPNENSYGAVWLLRGNSSGINTSGVLSVSARDVGVTTSGQGWFGIALATAGEQPRTPA